MLSTRLASVCGIAVLACLSIASLAVPAEPARAQGLFDYGYSNAQISNAKKRQEQRRREQRRRQQERANGNAGQTSSKKPAAAALSRQPDGPLVLNVSLRRQRISVYDANGLLTEAPISSGRIGYNTPTGVFSILQKNRTHFSNLYDSAPMPNMQRITWSGVALHAGQLPGYPASHGCIRLPHAFSRKLFEITKMGTRVIVTQDPVEPARFAHDRLFRAHPSEAPPALAQANATHALLPSGETRLADASASTLDSVTGGVNEMVGVTTAHASDKSASKSPLEILRAQRIEGLARLEAAVGETQSAKETAAELARTAKEAADEAKAAVREAKAEFDRLAANARKAAAARDQAAKKLEGFDRSLARKSELTEAEVEKASATEVTLENQVMDLEDAADKAHIEAEAAEKAYEAAQAAAATAEEERLAANTRLKEAEAAVTTAREADAAAKRRETKRNHPIHVFISRKTGKIYARQGYEPILEAPVTITDPDRLMGTHVFTALAVGETDQAVTWNVTSIPTTPPSSGGQAKNKKQREAQAAAAAALAAEARKLQTPDEALARITIPDDIRLKIEDVLKTGSSLIVSDNGLSNETGKFTDFIVPVR